MRKIAAILSLFTLAMPAAHAVLAWQPAPPESKPPLNGGGHQGHGGQRGGKPFVLLDGEGAAAQMWLPTLVRRPLHVGENGQVSVSGTGLDNYHLLFALKKTDKGEEVALRYLYQNGKPSGESPADLINHGKAMLEIIPAPLTREHQRYLSQKPVSFLVHYNGKPLAKQLVTLSSSNGTTIDGETDSEGYITLTLPDDFSEVEPGRRNNAPADFVVETAFDEKGKRYRTTLSAPYYVNPSHWRSTLGGLIAMFVGALTGFVVLRRSRKANADAGRV